MTHGTPALLYAEVGFTGRRIAERIEAAVSDRGDRRDVARTELRSAPRHLPALLLVALVLGDAAVRLRRRAHRRDAACCR